jgi:hypothetical protein
VEHLLQELKKESGRYEPFVWWEPLRNNSRSAIDIDALRGREDFSSTVIAFNEKLAEDWNKLNRLLDETFQPMSSVVGEILPNYMEGERNMEEGLALLAEAETRALDLLEGRDGP